MKSYFIRLFNYDAYANRKMNALIQTSPPNSKAVALMAHLLMAQQIWIVRCQGGEFTGMSSQPDWPADQLEDIISANHGNWMAFLEALDPEHLDTIIQYKNLKGDAFENRLSDILGHVVNHGTHHRAQIGQLYKQPGINLPVTDYAFYLRELDNPL